MKLASIPSNPIPDGVVAGTIRTPDGVELRFARLDSTAGKGTVCVFGGRGEFIEKYFETIGELRGAALRLRPWTGGDRGAPPGNCLMRARGMLKTSWSTKLTSRLSCSK